MGHFYYAAKAFDILERLDSDNEYEDALRGAIVGIKIINYKRCILDGYSIKRDNRTSVRGNKYAVRRRTKSLSRIYDESN